MIAKIIGTILLAAMLAGCSGQHAATTTAGLITQDQTAWRQWELPEHLASDGTGNLHRVVSDPNLSLFNALELAAGGSGQMTYWREITSDVDVSARMKLQMLSTQGTGRLAVSALDDAGQVIGTVGWVITGEMQSSGSREKWLDKRYDANFKGDWLVFQENPAELLAANLPGVDLSRTRRYRMSITAGQGQHALVADFHLETDRSRAVVLQVPTVQYSAVQGETVNVSAVVRNVTRHPVDDAAIEVVEPDGFGLVSVSDRRQIVHLDPGEQKTLVWQIKAQRPSTVNRDKPWPLDILAEGRLQGQPFITVSDPRPGKVFYVMTEDLEPIDSAGYAQPWGNGDGWLEPDELIVQMKQKSERLNSIADQYGARWTHYIAWPVVRAAGWAAGHSRTGQWPVAAEQIRNSVREQSAHGHEYALHFHMDYDPALPGNILSYNPDTDGLWANHLRHGWAHSVDQEGLDFSEYSSRTGLLYSYQSELEQLESNWPFGQLLTARMGSFDFGVNGEDAAKSIRAYRRAGLWGSSDADGNMGGITSGEFGREIYFSGPDSIQGPANTIRSIGLVEFRPTPRDFIGYDGQPAAVLNAKADQGMRFFLRDGKIEPGVHAIVGFTHAMFMMGNGDWHSLDGEQFAVLDEHLRYLKSRYVDGGQLSFATATELVRAYLDYYAPDLIAVYGNCIRQGWGTSEYKIDLLGSDIPVDSLHPHQVSVKYPLHLRDSAYRVRILKNGQPLYATSGLPTPYNDIVFTVDDRQAEYVLQVYHNHWLRQIVTAVHSIKGKITGRP